MNDFWALLLFQGPLRTRPRADRTLSVLNLRRHESKSMGTAAAMKCFWSFVNYGVCPALEKTVFVFLLAKMFQPSSRQKLSNQIKWPSAWNMKWKNLSAEAVWTVSKTTHSSSNWSTQSIYEKVIWQKVWSLGPNNSWNTPTGPSRSDSHYEGEQHNKIVGKKTAFGITLCWRCFSSVTFCVTA